MVNIFILIIWIWISLIIWFNIWMYHPIRTHKFNKILRNFIPKKFTFGDKNSINRYDVTQHKDWGIYKVWLRMKDNETDENSIDKATFDLNDKMIFTNIFNTIEYFNQNNTVRKKLKVGVNTNNIPTCDLKPKTKFWYDFNKKVPIIPKEIIKENKAKKSYICSKCKKIIRSGNKKASYYFKKAKHYHPKCWDIVQKEMVIKRL